MSRRIVATLLFVFIFSSLACSRPAAEGRATPDAEPQIIRADQLREAVALPSSEEVSPLVAEVMSDHGHYRYLVVRREESGAPEVHAAWADVTVVREGSGTLVYGGRVEGGEETEPGEVRGGQIVDGRQQRLAAGDVVVLPARVPHQIQLDEGESIVYTVVKVARPGAGG